MSSFPGEHTNIPKRLVESLEFEPLSYLVPKGDLAGLLQSQLNISIATPKDAFSPPPPALMEYPYPINLDLPNKDMDTPLRFKRPENLLKKPDSPELNLFDGLSALAKKCLDVTPVIGSDRILSHAIKTGDKHSREEDKSQNVDVEMIDSHKKVRTSMSVTVNQVTLGDQYLKHLDILMESIGRDETSAETSNLQYWNPVGTDLYISTDLCLEKVQIVLKNILSVPTVWPKIEADVLQRLLSVCTTNIKICKEQVNIMENEPFFQRVALGSASVIFMVFLLDKNDSKLYLEEYFLAPIQFISETVELIKEDSQNLPKHQMVLLLLQATLSLLPPYVKKRPNLDDGFVTKLVYMFSDLLMSNFLYTAGNIQLQNCLENIKSISTQVLVTIFEKLPEQRMFIIDELLSRLESLPMTRSQKKLKCINNSLYSTHFTFTLVSMLQTINSYDYCSRIDELNEDALADVSSYHQELQNALNADIHHINEVVLNKCFHNVSKYRYILENYTQDLLAMVLYPNWSISEIILDSLLKKLLLVFSPSQQRTANVEAFALQIAGNIGSTILDIRLSIRDAEDNNLIKIFNYPDQIEKLLDKFSRCFAYTRRLSATTSSTKFLWDKQVTILLKLAELGKDSEEWKAKINLMLIPVLKSIHSQSAVIGDTISNEDIEGIKKDYCSILYASELVGLYEPYLKLILSLLDKQKIKLRSGAIKCLSLLIAKDRNMLSTPMVKETIENRLNDSSASVKDAILDLVSLGTSYVTFYQQINLNYNDDSISVRKHVLKMNEKIYDESEDLSVKSYVANRLLKRIEDEEDIIIDAARSALMNRWFLCILDLENSPELQEKKCREIISVIAMVVSSGEKSYELFSFFLNFYVLNNSVHPRDLVKKIISSVQKLTNIMIELAIEMQSCDADDMSESQLEEKNRVWGLLAMFSECDRPFITKDQIVALYPYLFSAEKFGLQYYTLKIFKNSFNKLSNFKPKFLYDLETSLLGKLPRMNVREIEEAIPLAWSVSIHRKDDSRISKACSSCLKHLSPYINGAATNPSSVKLDGKLQRLLYLATGFSRFCKLENTPEKFPNLKTRENIFEYVTKCLLVFTKKEIPHILRRISIKNLIKISSSYPKLFNSHHVLKVFDLEFENGTLDIKLVMLESFYDFFLEEEQRSIKQAGVNATVSSSEALKKRVMRYNKTESVNDGICSALVLRYLDKILDICLISDAKSSLVAIRFLKLILDYGYTNPALSIPTLIALTNSNSQYMRNLVFSMLRDIFEKYESMVFSTLGQGIKLAVTYSKQIYGALFYKEDSFLRRIQEMTSTNKKNTTKLLIAVKKVFQNYCNNINSDSDTRDAILFLCFNLARISFENQLELYTFVKSLDLSSEQLVELIKDHMKDLSTDLRFQRVSNLIVCRLSLDELRRFLFKTFALSNDKLLLVGTAEEADLKSKSLPLSGTHTAHLDADSIFLNVYDVDTQHKEICTMYANMLA